jgi:hypothetical protein
VTVEIPVSQFEPVATALLPVMTCGFYVLIAAFGMFLIVLPSEIGSDRGFVRVAGCFWMCIGGVFLADELARIGIITFT